ncbi:hypothetical protein ASG00_08675, partial [Microbacterium sp. Leaf351]
PPSDDPSRGSTVRTDAARRSRVRRPSRDPTTRRHRIGERARHLPRRGVRVARVYPRADWRAVCVRFGTAPR